MNVWRSAALLSLAALGGCALTSKAEPLSTRFFDAAHVRAGRAEPAPRAYELRLGQVSSASHLDERIAYRLSSTEVGFYDDRRWTELPEAYLRRALEQELFQQRGLTRVITGVAPVLDVELVAFEELREKPTRVRVVLAFGLRDDRRAWMERRVELEAAVDGEGDSAPRVAQALASTLAEAVRRVGAEVVQQLAAPPRAVEVEPTK
jgi:cholesterol transport system auxiliary component